MKFVVIPVGVPFLFVVFPFLLSAQNQFQQVGLDIDGEAASDQLGWSTSLSADGKVVAIGARGNDGNGSNAGHVRIYDLFNGNWTQRGADIEGEASGDESGYSVSLSPDGNTLVTGAVFNNLATGHARVYDWSGTVWTQRGADIEGEAVNDQSGCSTSMSSNGRTFAIGARGNNGNGSNAGQVRVYDWSGSWTQRGADIDGEASGDNSGFTVALSADGMRVAIGAPFNDGNGSNAGHVRVYEWSKRAWIQVGMDIDGEMMGDNSGKSVALSADGNTVVIGAPFNDGSASEAGQVRVYDLFNGNWTQRGADIDGEASGDNSGYSVALSADGMRVAVGAPFNDGNGSNAGHVRVYEWSKRAWTQVGMDIDGEMMGDNSGKSVALSADGNTVAIGAPFNDGSASGAGHVRAYEWNGNAWVLRGSQ